MNKDEIFNHFGIYQIGNIIYIGKFSRNKKFSKEDVYYPSKIGKIIFIDSGNFFQGEISRQSFNDFGEFLIQPVILSNKGDTKSAHYLGEFKNQTPNVIIIENYNDETIFEGLYNEKGKVIGKMLFSEGAIYEGEFKDNFYDGYVSIN